MTILLTGGAGFIGAATAERLLERGKRVVVLDNFNDYYPVSLKRDRIARLESFDDAARTYVDISAIQADLRYAPTTPIDVGIPAFVDWFMRYRRA